MFPFASFIDVDDRDLEYALTMSSRFFIPLVMAGLCTFGCLPPLDLDSLCEVHAPNCDFDGDGVLNIDDDFPDDPTCSVTPSCAGKECGSDGCGGSCGGCESGQMCSYGQCVDSCSPNCSFKQCGPDGCGGSCGPCSSVETCSAAGQCLPNSSGTNGGATCSDIITCINDVCSPVADSDEAWQQCATACIEMGDSESQQHFVGYINCLLDECPNSGEACLEQAISGNCYGWYSACFSSNSGGGAGSTGCSGDQVEDCNGGCTPEFWLGDGICDTALDCSQFSWDSGDCLSSGGGVVSGSCSGNCGGSAGSGCFCDDLCVQYGDCCDDACSVCGYC